MSEMSGARIQAKLTVSQPGDAHEQQADRVANAVMAAPSPGMQEMPTASTHAVQRRCADCDEEMGKKPGAQVQRMEQGAGAAPPVTPAVAANLHAMRGGGSVLPADTRAFFEPRFNADFSQVRCRHKGTQAEEAAQSIGAKAFTMGRDIGFAKGQYAPESREGRTLLAHELTHVVQQGGRPEQRRRSSAKSTRSRSPGAEAKLKRSGTQLAVVSAKASPNRMSFCCGITMSAALRCGPSTRSISRRRC